METRTELPSDVRRLLLLTFGSHVVLIHLETPTINDVESEVTGVGHP